MRVDVEMKVGPWRIAAYETAAGWSSLCERAGEKEAALYFGPFGSRERARRVALFHALWCDGLLTEAQAVAMLEGRAEVVERRTADPSTAALAAREAMIGSVTHGA